MRALKLAFVFVAALLGGIASAFGAVAVVVTPVADTANYSTGALPAQLRYVAWNVQVTNTGASTSSPVLFYGRTRVADTQEKAVFSAGYGLPTDPRCVSSPLAPTAVVCLIPGLLPNQVFSFLVSYHTPMKVDGNGKFDQEGTDYVKFRGTTIAAENKDIYVDSDPGNQVTLLSPNASQASTVCGPDTNVSKTCNLFTGTNNGLPTTGDNFTTDVDAHLSTTLPTTINIVESQLSLSACTSSSSNLTECYTSKLTVPPNGTSFNPPLTIVLRQAISTVNKCSDSDRDGDNSDDPDCDGTDGTLVPIPIGSINVVYKSDVAPYSESTVAACTGGDGSALGSNQNECVPTGTAGRLKVGNDTDGYYQFTIISNHNGGWSVR